MADVGEWGREGGEGGEWGLRDRWGMVGGGERVVGEKVCQTSK